MLTQIYEVSDPDEATAISSTGVDHIGVLIGDGEFPREQTIEVAQRIAAAIHPPSKFSALFLTHNTTLIERWARKLRPHIVHLGAATDLLRPPQVAELKGKLGSALVMRSIPVSGEESIELAKSYETIADFLLLDSYRPSDRQIGALGTTHDWSISRRIVEAVGVPVIWLAVLDPRTWLRRYAKSVRRESIPRPKPIARDRTLRTSTGCVNFTRPPERRAISRCRSSTARNELRRATRLKRKRGHG